MNRLITIIGAVVLLSVVTVIIISSSQSTEDSSIVDEGRAVEIGAESYRPGEPTPTPIPQTQEVDAALEDRYVNYSDEAFANAINQRRVFFFHASWCPTCQVANREFSENQDQIPDDVVIFKTDFDMQSQLKAEHNITYQHTFVQVDADGNAISTWNGGAIDQLKRKII